MSVGHPPKRSTSARRTALVTPVQPASPSPFEGEGEETRAGERFGGEVPLGRPHPRRLPGAACESRGASPLPPGEGSYFCAVPGSAGGICEGFGQLLVVRRRAGFSEIIKTNRIASYIA